jgi:hypothetical protein
MLRSWRTRSEPRLGQCATPSARGPSSPRALIETRRSRRLEQPRTRLGGYSRSARRPTGDRGPSLLRRWVVRSCVPARVARQWVISTRCATLGVVRSLSQAEPVANELRFLAAPGIAQVLGCDVGYARYLLQSRSLPIVIDRSRPGSKRQRLVTTEGALRQWVESHATAEPSLPVEPARPVAYRREVGARSRRPG